MKTLRISAVVEQDKDGFYAYCPTLRGCHTQGDSIDEALTNLQEATELYIETLSEKEIEDLHAESGQIITTSLNLNYA